MSDEPREQFEARGADTEAPPPAAADGAAGRRLPDEAWHRMLLPWMTRFLVGAGLVFATATMLQLFGMQSAVIGVDDPVSREALRRSLEPYGAAYLLELSALERRYQQTNAALLTRTWIKYLGFLTGMTMMFVGGVYIVGKLQEELSSADVGAQGVEATLSTSSPGIFVTACGTAIILVTIFVNHGVDTRDGALYVTRTGPAPATATAPTEEGDLGLLRPEQREYLAGAVYTNDCDDDLVLRYVASLRAAPESATPEERAMLDRHDAACEDGGNL